MKTWIHSIVSIIKRTDTDHVLKTGQHLFFTVFMAHAWLLFSLFGILRYDAKWPADLLLKRLLLYSFYKNSCKFLEYTIGVSPPQPQRCMSHDPTIVHCQSHHKVNRHSQTRRTLMTLTQNFRRCCLSRLYYIFIYIIITINIERASLCENKGNSVSNFFLSNTKNKNKNS